MVPYTQDTNQINDDLKMIEGGIDVLREHRSRLRNLIQAQKRGSDEE